MFHRTTYQKRPHLRAHLTRRFIGGLIGILFLALAACTGGGTTPNVPTTPTIQAAATAIIHSAVGTITAAETATAGVKGKPLPIPTQAGQQDLGTAVDETRDATVTIVIGKPATEPSCQEGCVAPLNLKVRVGTKITWINESDWPRTITAVKEDTPQTARNGIEAPQIFDSGVDKLIYPGQTFSYTVSQAAYTFHANHKVFYLDLIHPSTLGELIIVP